MKMVLAITNETSHCAWHRVTPKKRDPPNSLH